MKRRNAAARQRPAKTTRFDVTSAQRTRTASRRWMWAAAAAGADCGRTTVKKKPTRRSLRRGAAGPTRRQRRAMARLIHRAACANASPPPQAQSCREEAEAEWKVAQTWRRTTRRSELTMREAGCRRPAPCPGEFSASSRTAGPNRRGPTPPAAAFRDQFRQQLGERQRVRPLTELLRRPRPSARETPPSRPHRACRNVA